MKPIPRSRSYLTVLGSAFIAISSASAAELYWDGTGSWDTTSQIWGTASGGTYDQAIWSNANNDTAIFEGTAGTVTLQEPIAAGGLTFNTASYVVTGNTLTLASGAIIHSTVGTGNSNDPVITSELAGTDGFTKTGTGWLGLEGTTSSLSGNINIAAGTLYARFSALGSANLVFTGDSNFTKVYNTSGTASTGFSINDGVTTTIGGSTFYYNFTTTGALEGNSSAKLVIASGGNTEKNFNSTSNTFAGEITLAGGGTADGGQRTGFRSLADSDQKIIFNDALFRLNNGGVSMNFANRQVEMTRNARLDNDSTDSAVTLSFVQDLSVRTGNNGRIFYLSGVNTGDNTFSGVIGNSSTGTGVTQLRKTEAGKWILGSSNTYTGKTTVDNGTLVVGSIKDIGTASSIGAGSTLQLGYYNTRGTLSYVGTGDSTDRPIQLNDYTTGTGNTGAGRILNDGTGALTFTASTFIPTNEIVVANRSLELGGSYTGAANEIQGVIQDIAPVAGKAIVSVVKLNDASTWVLSGENTHTGGTSVQGGLLTIDGSLADSSMTISGGAIDGAGTLKFNIDGTTADQVVMTGGTIDISGLAVEIVSGSGAGLTEPEYVLIDATGTPGAITGTFTGLNGATGYVLDYSTTDQVKLVQSGGSTPYDSWSGGEPFDGDSNGDGVHDGLAFLLGVPTVGTDANSYLPTVSETAGGLVMTFDMLDAASRGTATLHVEHSSDLGISDAWTAVAVPDATPDPQASDVSFVVSGTGTLAVEATIGSGEAAGGKLFGRLKATE